MRTPGQLQQEIGAKRKALDGLQREVLALAEEIQGRQTQRAKLSSIILEREDPIELARLRSKLEGLLNRERAVVVERDEAASQIISLEAEVKEAKRREVEPRLRELRQRRAKRAPKLDGLVEKLVAELNAEIADRRNEDEIRYSLGLGLHVPDPRNNVWKSLWARLSDIFYGDEPRIPHPVDRYPFSEEFSARSRRPSTSGRRVRKSKKGLHRQAQQCAPRPRDAPSR